MTDSDIEEIKRQIKEQKSEMKASGVKITSCFNAGLDVRTYRCNARLFRLKVNLEKAEKLQRFQEAHEDLRPVT